MTHRGSIPDYANLDASGEARAAARRMEARASAPASKAMFDDLVAPLVRASIARIDGPVRDASPRVLEIGCGTAPLARSIAAMAPDAAVFACDKSALMLDEAQLLADGDSRSISFAPWDVTDVTAFPFANEQFDLIVSSVMTPYIDDVQTASLIRYLAGRLAPGGAIAFIEQDLLTDSLNCRSYDLFARVFAKDARRMKATLALGLRPLLRNAGLSLLPRKSYIWTDDEYGTYARELIFRMAAEASANGRISERERDEWLAELNKLAAAGDFYYGLVYHRIAAERAPGN